MENEKLIEAIDNLAKNVKALNKNLESLNKIITYEDSHLYGKLSILSTSIDDLKKALPN